MKLIDLTGKKISKWTVLYKVASSRNGHTIWKCRCECGVEKDVYGTHLTYGKSNSCGVCSVKHGKDHQQWNGYEDISGNYWNSIKRGANGSKGRKAIEFNITKEYVWDLFIQQNRKCALSGLDLTINYKGGDHTASLDRIDSHEGYIFGNVQWVHKHINLMKGKLNQNYFIDLCKNVAKNNFDNTLNG